ncbi:MAG: BamA/TamA family outer membrane protein [Muribaculaceae bacterium]
MKQPIATIITLSIAIITALSHTLAAQVSPTSHRNDVPTMELVMTSDSVVTDALHNPGSDLPVLADSDTTAAAAQRKGFLQRFIGYFSDSNKEKKHKSFDISFIGGPSYTNDANFSIGLMGSGLYRMHGCDPDMQPSNVTIYTNTSVIGLVAVGVTGNNFFPQDRYRINYDLRFNYFPSNYWGVGFDECNNDDNETSMKRLLGRADAEFLVRLAHNLYIGPMFSAMVLKAYDIDEDKMHLYHGQDLKQHNIGLGITLQYDTRDNVTNPHRGVYLNLSQMFRPKFLANDYHFNTTDVTLNAYQQVWNGGVLAEQVKGQFNFGNPSWEMMASVGGSYVMRGYYKGRYRDKHMMATQVELRQHVWKRSGITLWGGAGTVFHNQATVKHVLPNFGVGFRWEFKKNVNVRLDYGFGRNGQSGFVFNVNEAF